jgi:DMSO reductase anchor subunit
MLLAALAASFLHLGRPERAWRAVLMWRRSWLSREVIVLPAFIAVVALWWLAHRAGWEALTGWPLPWAAIGVAMALWVCTGMVYACLHMVQEWAHPLTLLNLTLIGLSSGLVAACALAGLAGEGRFLQAAGPWTLAATLAAWAARALSLRRIAALEPRSTLQSATGIRAARVRQVSMGMSAGAFNTREFFHRATEAALRNVKLVGTLLGFALPAALALCGVNTEAAMPWELAPLAQAPGLLAERWYFFAQVRHPQNLYYQVVS